MTRLHSYLNFAGNEPNLRKLEPSRKKVRAGDVFVMLPPDGKGYLFGRVIDTEADAGGFGPAVLLYTLGRTGEGPRERTPS